MRISDLAGDFLEIYPEYSMHIGDVTRLSVTSPLSRTVNVLEAKIAPSAFP